MRKLLCIAALAAMNCNAANAPRITGNAIREMEEMVRVSREYKLSPLEKKLLFAIRRQENGAAGLEFGVANDRPSHPARRYKDGHKSFKVQARWAAGTIKRRFRGCVKSFARIYCPDGHETWAKNVAMFIGK